MVGEKLFKKFSAWFARKSLETKLKDEEKKREELESKRKCSVLDSILKCKIHGFSGFSIIDGKISCLHRARIRIWRVLELLGVQRRDWNQSQSS